MAPPDASNLTSDAISGHGSKKYQNGHLCVSGLKLLATTVCPPGRPVCPPLETNFRQLYNALFLPELMVRRYVISVGFTAPSACLSRESLVGLRGPSIDMRGP